jgi:hypothetical protein
MIGANLVTIECRLRAELSVEFDLKRLGWKLGRELSLQRVGKELAEPSRLKDVRADAQVKRVQRVDSHAASEPRRDDRSGRGSADEIEIIANQRVVAEPLFDQGLYRLKELERENAPNAPAVERENAFRPGVGIEMLSLCERQLRVSRCNHFHPRFAAQKIWI